MILLPSSNLVLREVVAGVISPDDLEDKEGKEALDVKLCDFDDVTYHVQITKEAPKNLLVSMNMPFFHQIGDKGAKATLSKIYGDAVSEPKVGYDVTLNFDLAKTRDDKEKAQLIDSLATLKTYTIGGVFDHLISALLDGQVEKPISFNLRSDNTVYFCPRDDRVTIIFGIDFNDKVDKAIAKVFMQEFAEARRRIKSAPPCAWDQNPPRELADFGVTENSKNLLGFCSFAVQKGNIEGVRKEAVVASLQSFRNYIQYHIKCAKSYFHSRMRLRAVNLLKVLNRAKVEVREEKAMKTSSGKTFKRN